MIQTPSHNIIIPQTPYEVPDKITIKMKKIGARLTEVTVLSPEGILSDPGGAEIGDILPPRGRVSSLGVAPGM